jgi:hypothetical protein
MTDSKFSVWLIAATVSALLLAFVFINLDIKILNQALAKLQPGYLLPAFVLLTVEAMITARRIQYFAMSDANYGQGLYANAWYVMWLNILPARLGEVAAISVFKRVFSMPPGAAIASIVTQRLFDLLMLAALLIGLLSVSFLDSVFSLFINIALVIAVISLIATIGKWIDLACRFLYQIKNIHAVARRLLLICLQGRRWYKRDFSQLKVWHVLLQTFIKWVGSVLGVAFLLAACQLELLNTQLLLVAILTNFLGAVPLQSIGGFGVIEAGLSGILYSFGIPLSEAVAVSLLLRFAILAYVLVFFSTCVLLLKGKIQGHG